MTFQSRDGAELYRDNAANYPHGLAWALYACDWHEITIRKGPATRSGRTDIFTIGAGDR